MASEPRQPNRLRALDNGGAVGQNEPARQDRATERVGDRRGVPLAAERMLENERGALASVGDGKLGDVEALDCGAARPRAQRSPRAA